VSFKLGIIGGGTIGSEVARGGIAARVLAPTELIVADLDPARREEIARLGCVMTDDARRTLEAEQVLLAVKPQQFSAVAERLGTLSRPTIVVTIMAGIPSSRIRKTLGEHARVVRAMPNTPCQVGEGMTGIALGAGAKPGDDALTHMLFESLGKTVTVAEEAMDAVTAVSGSGPAYVYLLAELMEKAAVELGFDEATAQMLVVQTVIGAGRMLRESAMDPLTLRQAVTTPGGTTAAAMDVLFGRDLPTTIVDALRAARDRGPTLGGEAP